MIIDSFNLQNIILIINFFILFLIFIYAFYLYSIEKKIRGKYSNLEKWVNEVIASANKRALEILMKSDYISNSLKNEINQNFETILTDLKGETRKFYKELSDDYRKMNRDFIEKLERDGMREIHQFGESMANEASKIEHEFDSTLRADYEAAKSEISAYKNQEISDIENELHTRVSDIAIKILPNYIPLESQERLVMEILSRLKAEKLEHKS